MKKFLSISFVFLACQKPPEMKETFHLSTDEQKLGYAIGIDIGNRLKETPHKIDLAFLLEGVEQVYLNKPRLVSEDSIKSLQRLFQRASDHYESGMQARRDSNLVFLERNKKEPGVVELPNGLQYQVLSKGTSIHRPIGTDRVKIQIKGYLLNGKLLENSYLEGQPRLLTVNNTIEGLKAALQLMTPGMKLKAWIFPPLAYGRRAIGGDIPEYALLVYEIELLEILPGSETHAKAKINVSAN